MNFQKPKILISKCLEFEPCRYDGQLISNKYVSKLKKYVDFITVCPELGIGLGTPREPIHLVKEKNNLTLYQPSSDKDLGISMNKFSNIFLESLTSIDGFIMKSKSPSCGIFSAKLYPNKVIKSPMGYGSGMFAKKVIEKFPDHPKEEDKRLHDVLLREHFYTSIFTICEFRNVKSLKSLYNFQAKHKLLFMVYNQTKMRVLGKIAANYEFKKLNKVLQEYFEILLLIFSKRPSYLSNINTQMHAFGYYKKYLSAKEKIYFLELLDDYRENYIPLSTINSVMKGWNTRFKNEYLLNQSYFNPFPDQLIELQESRMK